MDFSTRLKQIISNQGLSIRAFEEKIGCSVGVINRCISKKTDVTSSVVIKIISTCREINPDWLLIGEGDMMRDGTKNFAPTVPENGTKNFAPTVPENGTKTTHVVREVIEPVLPKIKKREKESSIPLIPLYAMAGNFPGESEIKEYDCTTYSIPGLKGADFMIQVKGNSMQPTYNSGDIVACRRINNIKDSYFHWNRVYVLDTDQGPIMKRIKPGTDQDSITIVSDNPDFEPFQLHLSQIYRLALVLGCIKIE